MQGVESLLSVSLLTALISAVVSVIVAQIQASRTARNELSKRQSDLSIEVSKLLIRDETAVGAARRFAIGVAKVLDDKHGGQQGLVCFIPIYSRVTIGRDSSNDIVLNGPTLSRFHCGFFSEAQAIYIEDYRSTNGTRVNGKAVASGKSLRLQDGDEILISDYEIKFHYIHRSKILTQ
jgi:cell division protein FtsL